jgi:hypothetical protein
MIYRYVLVDEDNNEGEYEYATLGEAKDVAIRGERATGVKHAVVERVYTFEESELVWTPDGLISWPPRKLQPQLAGVSDG